MIKQLHSHMAINMPQALGMISIVNCYVTKVTLTLLKTFEKKYH